MLSRVGALLFFGQSTIHEKTVRENALREWQMKSTKKTPGHSETNSEANRNLSWNLSAAIRARSKKPPSTIYAPLRLSSSSSSSLPSFLSLTLTLPPSPPLPFSLKTILAGRGQKIIRKRKPWKWDNLCQVEHQLSKLPARNCRKLLWKWISSQRQSRSLCSDV